MKTKIIYSQRCLEYGGITIPENSQRILFAAQFLKNKGYDFIIPEPANESDILAIHNKQYIEAIKSSTTNDPDTPAYDNVYEYAKLAAGGAIAAANTNGFSLMRPPGHHCGISGKAMGAFTRGFCYLNNIAVAVQAINKKTIIIDIDGHHGNGTQEIFSNNPKVAYLSLHRNNVFPQTGSSNCGNCYNYPLEADCGGILYLKALKKLLKEATRKIKTAEVAAISAGFDTHTGDIVSLGLREDDYFNIGKEIKKLSKPTFFVLEGGYNGSVLGSDIDALIEGFEI